MNTTKFNFLRKALVATAFSFLAFFATAQSTNDFAFADREVAVLSEQELDEAPATKNNMNKVSLEISQYLQNNLEFRDDLFWVYNTDVRLTASLKVTEEGRLEEVTIVNAGDHPMLEKLVIAQLMKMKSVTPVVENGEVVARDFFIPVFFDFD